MSPTIEVSQELYDNLASLAKGFDTPEDVIASLYEAKTEQLDEGRYKQKGQRMAKTDYIHTIFKQSFGVIPRPFGQKSSNVFGVCDDNNGVQWNLVIERDKGKARLGVNLEGMKYGGKWPIGTLLNQERSMAGLTMGMVPSKDAEKITVRLTRDAWQVSSRPAIKERHIGKSPCLLSELTMDEWISMTKEGLDCLNYLGGAISRGKQMITLSKSGEKREMEISPHLALTTPLWESTPQTIEEGLKSIEDAKLVLAPIYNWMSYGTSI